MTKLPQVRQNARMSLQFYSLWPSSVLVAQLEELSADNEKLCQIGRDFFFRNANLSSEFKYRGNTHSLMMEVDAPELVKLFKVLKKHIEIYLERFYPSVSIEDLGFQYNSFVNLQDKDKKWALPHAHLGQQLVATYYPMVKIAPNQESESSGAICFHDPRPVHANWMVRQENPVFAQPLKSGTLVIFPGYLKHSTFPFFNEQSEKLAIVTNVRFFPRTDKNQERMHSEEEIKMKQSHWSNLEAHLEDSHV